MGKIIFLTKDETEKLQRYDNIVIERDGYSILIKIEYKGKPYEKIYASFINNIIIKYR